MGKRIQKEAIDSYNQPVTFTPEGQDDVFLIGKNPGKPKNACHSKQQA